MNMRGVPRLVAVALLGFVWIGHVRADNLPPAAPPLSPDEEGARAWYVRQEGLWERHWSAGLEAYNAGRYADAEKQFAEARAIAREHFSHTDKRFLETHDNLALASLRTGDSKKAIGHYEEAVMARESALGKGHPSLCPSLDNVGAAYMAEKEYDKAEVAFRRSLEIRDLAYGKDSAELAKSL